MNDLGKTLVLAGLALVGVGLVVMAGGKLPWLGRLPGDIVIDTPGFRFYFPLTTCILLSLLLYLLSRLFGK